jgi:hypothetical protein
VFKLLLFLNLHEALFQGSANQDLQHGLHFHFKIEQISIKYLQCENTHLRRILQKLGNVVLKSAQLCWTIVVSTKA